MSEAIIEAATAPVEEEQKTPEQAEMPFAIVQGQELTTLPKDLYIPPDALEVFLDAFEGPLDLLLYLIKRQNLDILHIPVAQITAQYTQYIELMTEMRIELAAEYLVMAAMLAEIKSRMLLPRAAEEAAEDDDPRAELIRRLQEYERYKTAAQDIENLPQLGKDVFTASAEPPELHIVRSEPDVKLQELLVAFGDVLKRTEMFDHHHIQMEPLSVRERMSNVLNMIKANEFSEFHSLFDASEGRMGVVVTLLAVLELLKEGLIELVQAEAYAPIHIKAKSSVHLVSLVEDTAEDSQEEGNE